jgi:hypothetical protein
MTIDRPFLTFDRRLAGLYRARWWPEVTYAERVDATGMLKLTLRFGDPNYVDDGYHIEGQKLRQHTGPFVVFYDPRGDPPYTTTDSMDEAEFRPSFMPTGQPNQYRRRPWLAYKVTEQMLDGTNGHIRNRGTGTTPDQTPEVKPSDWLVEQSTSFVLVFPNHEFDRQFVTAA